MRVPSQLRFCLARARMGQREAAERDLAAILSERGTYINPWGLELLRFVAGLSSEEALFDEAEGAPAEWRYQAYFYAAEVRVLNGDREEAKVLFKRCIELGSKDDRECKSATAELRALEKQ